VRPLSISPTRRDIAITAALLLAAAVLAALLAARAPLGIDYSGPAGTLCDCPGTPIRALAHGRLHDFLATQPVMGSFSLLLRAPFALLGLHATGGSELDLYRLGAFPCLFAAGLLAVYLFGRLRDLGRPPLTLALVPLLLVMNPLTGRALRYGHPEEILAAALCVGAVLAAGRRRPLAAGVLLGAAFATKQWALLAVLPVLIAAGEQRARVGLTAAATAALLIVPMAAGDLHRFLHGNHGAGVVAGTTMPTNIWFPFGTNVQVLLSPNGASTPPRALPSDLAAITHPLILIAGFGLALAWWRCRRGAPPEDALLLLALILLVRCLLDPMTNSYYHLPFLVSLAAWEGLRRRGAPLLTVAATLLIGLTISLASSGADLVQLNRFYLAWTLPLAGLLAALAFRPQPEPAALAEPA
jgi:RsiW-degrading membrane proteinase PrsW (M82 family)